MTAGMKPFQPELPEGCSVQRESVDMKKGRLFAPEPEEPSSSESDSSVSDAKEPSVFNFGWHSLHAAAKSRFTREAEQAGKPVVHKRAYDNSARSSQATYDWKKSSNKYRENGLSEERLLNVLAREQCNCNPGCALAFLFICLYTPLNLI